MLKQLRSLCCKMQPGFVFIGNDKIQDRDNKFYEKSVFFQFEEKPLSPRHPEKIRVNQEAEGGRENLGKAFVLLPLEEQGRQS